MAFQVPEINRIWVLVYVAGVLIGLTLGRDRPPVRLALALAWPLGPLAFGVTVSMLLAVAAIAFPTFGALLVAAGAVGWWAVR